VYVITVLSVTVDVKMDSATGAIDCCDSVVTEEEANEVEKLDGSRPFLYSMEERPMAAEKELQQQQQKKNPRSEINGSEVIILIACIQMHVKHTKSCRLLFISLACN